MANNYLITGYWGEPHVTPENDRGFNAAIFGAGRFVLPVGERFRAEYIGNSTVRIYDGQLLDNGARAGIPAGTYVDLLIPEAGQGMNRSDLIVFQYTKDSSSLVETGQFIVLTGEESAGDAFDPALTQQDLLTDTATLDQMALWRVTVSGAVINAPAQMFTVQGVGGGTVDVLWENADVREETSFSAQYIYPAKDLKDYSEIIVFFKNGQESVAGRRPIGVYGRIYMGADYPARTQVAWYTILTQSVVYTREFTIYPLDNSVYFFGATSCNLATDQMSDANTYLVPLVIYGVRGVVVK